MAVFNYTARDAAGVVTEGTVDAPLRRDALRKLQARGLKPVKVEEAGAAVRAEFMIDLHIGSKDAARRNKAQRICPCSSFRTK
jgi:type II secretory pathway component PulF